MIFGYTYITNNEHNLGQEISELRKFGCHSIFYDKQPGKNPSRQRYNYMRSLMGPGDLLVVHDLNRFGRNVEDICNEWKEITDNKIDIVVLHMSILDTRKYKDLDNGRNLVPNILPVLLSWVVKEERKRIRIAQREGIEQAKARGVFKGRKKRYHADAKGKDKILYDEVLRLLKEQETIINIHRKTGLSRNTIYSIKQNLRDKKLELN